MSTLPLVQMMAGHISALSLYRVPTNQLFTIKHYGLNVVPIFSTFHINRIVSSTHWIPTLHKLIKEMGSEYCLSESKHEC
jgi:hypothetical protein